MFTKDTYNEIVKKASDLGYDDHWKMVGDALELWFKRKHQIDFSPEYMTKQARKIDDDAERTERLEWIKSNIPLEGEYPYWNLAIAYNALVAEGFTVGKSQVGKDLRALADSKVDGITKAATGQKYFGKNVYTYYMSKS